MGMGVLAPLRCARALDMQEHLLARQGWEDEFPDAMRCERIRSAPDYGPPMLGWSISTEDAPIDPQKVDQSNGVRKRLATVRAVVPRTVAPLVSQMHVLG